MAKYYSLKRIRKTKALYKMVIGQRSNGKTYAWGHDLLERRITDGETTGAYIRRNDIDITPKNLADLFKAHNIEEMSSGIWNDTEYRNRAFTLVRRSSDTGEVEERDSSPFCYTAALSNWESRKGVDHGYVQTICFDEFMTRDAYLRDEFVKFMNVLSSFIRDRDGTEIFMLANTVNKYCPYFKEMGLIHVPEMEPGTIQTYELGDGETTVAVEMCAESQNTRKVKKYFAFDNPQLQMITAGSWEISLYPHCPIETTKYDILKRFYIKFNGNMIAGDIIKSEKYLFILYHPHYKNYEIKEDDVAYLETNDGLINHCKYIADAPTEAHKLIKQLISTEREFYSDNETGEIIRNWKMNVSKLHRTY